ncbi:ABC transporter ATP-binding protein [Paenibacillus antri]|uniref:ABC transporter ATP-binding protein n=1 Tax=Paenibacillus antri TaxID=2582848 RepID=A0A5R9GMT6_9BACL|nr:ABC transporter ATP-binding protein [Paenibacillus antri]TLS53305.1 ABC transporter ATP-binding protein [Paenibacillus antri]
MKLVFRYLKPFAAALTVSIVFLFVQVLCDLGLPRLMSDMVDTGIQAGGIEQGAPEAISAEGVDLLKTFLSEQDAETLANGYASTPAGEGGAIAERFPAAGTQDVYRLTERDGERSEAVDEVYTRAAYAMALTMQSLQQASPEGAAGQGDTGSLELSQLYAMAPMFAELKASGGLDAYIAAAAGDESMAGSQIAVMFTRLFYGELGVDLKQFQRDYIVGIGLKMLGVALLGGVAAIVVGWYASKIGTSVAMRMRRDVFEKVGRFSNAEYDKFSTASLITRTTNDVQQIQTLILMGIRLLLFAPIMGVGGIILAIRSSASMSWIIAVAVIAIVGIILIMFALAVPKFKTLQKLIDKLNLVSRENLSGMMVIRAFGNERYEEGRFEQANDNLRRTNRFVQRTMAFLFPAMTLVMNLITLLIIWVGAHQIAASELQIGNMMAFMQYAMQIIMSFLFMSMMFLMVPRAIASAERIQEVLNTELTIREPADAKTFERGDGVTVEFDRVSFRYGNAEEAVLEDISFTAKPGQTTAFIGTTGARKSTLVNLVPRFYDVTAGRITLNGIDIRELSQKELRETIGYVPQKGILFTGDIASNVRYGYETADETEVREALEVAQASGFIEKMEQGVASPISQGGTNVSGGQRQRLAIARALIRKAPVYIFDDSFSALDLKTDAALRRALKQFTSNATVLVVAQRVSTIKNAEQIIVLDHGRIVGKGTHEKLLESCPTYRDIAESQLTKEELG